MTDLTHTFGLVNANAKINLEESIEVLNALHHRLNHGVNTDLELLKEMKELLNIFKYVYQPQPIEIAFGLVVKDKEYVERFRNYWNLLMQKFHATQEGRFQDAAKLRDEARNEMERATTNLLSKIFESKGPLYIYQGRVLYHKLDSRVKGLL